MPSEILQPEHVWPGRDEFAKTLNKLGHMFVENFKHFGCVRACSVLNYEFIVKMC